MAQKTQNFRPLSATSFYTDANLVRYYTMDDLTEKNGNTLTNSGCSATTGKFTGAYSSGVSNTGNRMYNTTNVGINGGACTISAWIKLDSTHTVSDHPLAISEYSSSAGILNGIGFNQSNTAVQFSRLREAIAWNDATYSYSPGNSDWNHYAYTYDGSTVRGYVNGVLVTSASASGSGTHTERTEGVSALANYHRGIIDNPFSGQVDDVAFFTRALSGTEIATIYSWWVNYEFGLGQYQSGKLVVPFDGNAYDFSGNGYDGTPTNVTWEDGKQGNKSARFNGSNANAYFGSAGITTTQPITFGFWFKMESTSDWCIIQRGNLWADWGVIVRTESWLMYYYVHNAPIDYKLNTNLYPSVWVWYRAVFVWTPWTMECWINGQKTASQSCWTSVRTSTSYWWNVGSHYPTSYANFLNGNVDWFFLDYKRWDASMIEKDYIHTLWRFR